MYPGCGFIFWALEATLKTKCIRGAAGMTAGSWLTGCELFKEVPGADELISTLYTHCNALIRQLSERWGHTGMSWRFFSFFFLLVGEQTADESYAHTLAQTYTCTLSPTVMMSQQQRVNPRRLIRCVILRRLHFLYSQTWLRALRVIVPHVEEKGRGLRDSMM